MKDKPRNPRKSTKRSSAGPKPPQERAAAPAVPERPAPPAPAGPAEEHFVRGVLTRGEAAVPGPNGELPPGATHEIVGENAQGLPQIRRRRFNLY